MKRHLLQHLNILNGNKKLWKTLIDQPSNNKRGSVCIYYKASLPLRVIDICFQQKCITFEVMIGNKQCNFVALYRSPSQNQGEFDSFKKNLAISLDKFALNNPFKIVVIGNLNEKSKNWYPLERTTYEGRGQYN